MKNKTQQAEPNPCPKGPSTVAAIIVICAAGLASAGLFWVVPKLAKNYYNRPVTCHECDHIVARSSASQKKKFKHYFGKDEEYTTLYFCKEHPQKWDYALDAEGTEAYFKKQYDHQVDRSGCEITNAINYRIFITPDSNNVFRSEDGRTNASVGGDILSKHIVH